MEIGKVFPEAKVVEAKGDNEAPQKGTCIRLLRRVSI